MKTNVRTESTTKARDHAYGMSMEDSRGRVLIADIDEAMRDLLIESLKAQGFFAVGAESADEVLEKATVSITSPGRRGEFDAIILDVLLNEADDFELIEKLRSKGVNAHIILLSAILSDAMFEKSDRFAPSSILGKPFRLTQLLNLIEGAVAISQAL